MGDVVARRRIDAIKRLEEHPTLAELFGDGGEVRVAVAGEAVAQAPFPVSGIGEIEAGLAFEDRLAARYPLACQTDGEQRISYRRAFAHRATSAAAAFEVAGSEVDALGERAVNLFGVEAHDLGERNGGPENAEHRTGMKSPRQDGGNEIRRQTIRDLVTRHHAGQKFAAGATRCLRRHERRRHDGAIRVNHHPEGVPLASGKYHPRIDEGGPGSTKAPPVDERRARAAATALFLLNEANGLLCFREIVAEQT